MYLNALVSFPCGPSVLNLTPKVPIMKTAEFAKSIAPDDVAHT